MGARKGSVNPYNARSIDALYVGRKFVLEKLATGLGQGKSYLVVGGRRMGKTTLLSQLAKRCAANDLRFSRFSVQSAPGLTVAATWMWSEIVSAIVGRPIDIPANHADPYRAAREALSGVTLEGRVAVGIDEADILLKTPDSASFFNNLRNFLGESAWRGQVTVVASAAYGLGWFATRGSPLNNMSEVRLERLTIAEVRELADFGFSLTEAELTELERVCGGHPYLAQGTLEQMWGRNGDGGVEVAAKDHAASSPVFENWWEHFSESCRALYSCYAEASGDVSASTAQRVPGIAGTGGFSEAQARLAFHGVIAIGDYSSARVNGSLFRDWYRDRAGTKVELNAPEKSVGTVVKLTSQLPEKRPPLPSGAACSQGRWWLMSNPDTVFVFVHGVLSNSTQCWHAYDAAKGVDSYWPWLVANDKRLDYPSIFLGGYYAKIDSGVFAIEQAADALFGDLQMKHDDGKPPVTDFANIVFVAHSMGGLVVRQILRNNPPQLHSKHVGVVLVASPSLGSKWANVIGALLGGIIKNQQREQLEVGSAYLKSLNREFMKLKDGGSSFRLSGTDLFEHQFLLKFFRLFTNERTVKAENSHVFFGAANVIDGTDHSSIAKPIDRESRVHRALVGYYEKHFAKA